MTPSAPVSQWALREEHPRDLARRIAWGDPSGILQRSAPPDYTVFTALDQVKKRDAPYEFQVLPTGSRSRYTLHEGAVSPLVSSRAPLRPPRKMPPNLLLTGKEIRRAQRERLHTTRRRAVGAGTYERFQLLRQWEGSVLDVGHRRFTGSVLADDRFRRPQRIRMEFPRSLVRAEDVELLEEGALFFYCVGRFLRPGEATPGTILWFRRLPPSDESVQQLLERGKAWNARIAWAE